MKVRQLKFARDLGRDWRSRRGGHRYQQWARHTGWLTRQHHSPLLNKYRKARHQAIEQGSLTPIPSNLTSS